MTQPLTAQHAKMLKDVRYCVRKHKMTKAKRKEFEKLTLRCLKNEIRKGMQ
jgi:hypothetical protein